MSLKMPGMPSAPHVTSAPGYDDDVMGNQLMQQTPCRCKLQYVFIAVLTIGNVAYFYVTIKPNMIYKGTKFEPHTGTTPEGATGNNIPTQAVFHRNMGNISAKPLHKYTTARLLNHPASPSQLILVSQKRSGSSFVGELFNQNPDTFYVMEPLKSLTSLMKGATASSFGKASHDVLSAALRCDLHRVPVEGWTLERSAVSTCHDALDKTSYNIHCRDPARRYNSRQFLKVSSDACKHKSHLALKTIRVYDLEELKSFLTAKDLDVKVLHLVRDPRGVMASRLRVGEANVDFIRRKGDHADETLDLCQHMERNIAYGKYKPDWLKDRYKLIRYEDISERPHALIDEIYRFLGWELPDEVTDWLSKNTNHNAGDAFSRTRDSKTTSEAWRKSMSFYRVSDVQKKCNRVMKSLGYITYRSTRDMRDLSRRSFESF